ncbi:MAG: hypothetical protein AAF202_07165, partial [Pseudomonadota bacterium]
LIWIQTLRKENSPTTPICISAPQGAGKTTLARHLVMQLKDLGLKSVSISVDDFYFTREQQQQLSDSSSNPYLQQRGYPGTHDISLMESTLGSLIRGTPTPLPSYDKSLFSGLGDRAPQEQWSEVTQRQDFVFLEGWFLGFKAKGAPIADPNLNEINDKLKSYETTLGLFESLIYLKPTEAQMTINWRIEAEKAMRDSGKPGMTDKQAEQYIRKFLPAYHLYRETVEERADQFTNFKVISIGHDRLPLTA